MMRSHAPQEDELVRRRLRRWAAPLTEDSRLRDKLNDAQAGELLRWAEARLYQTAARTLHLPDDDAAALLEKESTAVRLIIRGVNDLLEGIGSPPAFDIIDDVLTRLLKNLRWLTEERLTPAQRDSIRLFTVARNDHDRAAAFKQLLRLLSDENQTSRPPNSP